MAIPTICELNLVAIGHKLNLNLILICPGTRLSPSILKALMISAIDDASQTELYASLPRFSSMAALCASVLAATASRTAAAAPRSIATCGCSHMVSDVRMLR